MANHNYMMKLILKVPCDMTLATYILNHESMNVKEMILMLGKLYDDSPQYFSLVHTEHMTQLKYKSRIVAEWYRVDVIRNVNSVSEFFVNWRSVNGIKYEKE